MRWNIRLLIFLTATCCFTSKPTNGHHSTSEYLFLATEFDGTLISVRWANPHIRLALQTDNGIQVHFIADTIANLNRLGVRKEMFRVGDRIRIWGRVSGNDDLRAMATKVAFSDGSDYKLWNGRRTRSPSDSGH